jgi:hypothetical protein
MASELHRGRSEGGREMHRTCLLVLVFLVAACSDRPPATTGDLGGARGDSWRDMRAPEADRAQTLLDGAPLPSPDRSRDRRIEYDAPSQPGPDAGMCGVVCKAGVEAHLISSCVATDKLFSCAPTCNPSSPSSCGPNATCHSWGGTPCCICSAAVAACVPKPTTGPIAGPLRINPTQGIAGQTVKLTIDGAAFYVGALFYNVRMGSETKMEEPGKGECSIGATFTPPNPGIYAVEVSQYGGGAPWVLAGFYTASGGSIPKPTVQPGYFCSMSPAPGDPACASAPPWSCSCVAGRCACK